MATIASSTVCTRRHPRRITSSRRRRPASWASSVGIRHRRQPCARRPSSDQLHEGRMAFDDGYTAACSSTSMRAGPIRLSMPTTGLTNSPSSSRRGTTRRRTQVLIAAVTRGWPNPPAKRHVERPTTLPREESSGPPLLPWLTVTVLSTSPSTSHVCRKRRMPPLISHHWNIHGASRPTAATTPSVSIGDQAPGRPNVATLSPTRGQSQESPSGVAELGRSQSTSSRTARSHSGLLPTTRAGHSSPLVKRTATFVESSTTWWFVTMWPSRSQTKPEPW
mmetsp:Transcript_28214/g.62223  ORF Transcript_28214/g.62223 Transcript_28214/m.62223 type:complete len:278 (+) Transcript_28214:710-1543(+)